MARPKDIAGRHPYSSQTLIIAWLTLWSVAGRTGSFAPLVAARMPLTFRRGRVWQCKTRHPKAQFSVKVGTVFEDSPLALDKWLPGDVDDRELQERRFQFAEMHRAIGVTQKTAWFMLHRIRLALGDVPENKMGGSGPVEVDETFVGPTPAVHAQRPHALGRGSAYGRKPKAVVMGMLDRDARQVRAKVIPNVKRETLQDEMLSRSRSMALPSTQTPMRSV